MISPVEPQPRKPFVKPEDYAAWTAVLLFWSVIIGMAFAYFIAWQWVWAAFFPIDLYIFSLCFIALHECSHALIGRLVGYELHQIAIGPILLEATPQGIRRSLRSRAGLKGYVKGEFPPALFKTWRAIMFIAGGPAIHAVTIVVLLVLLLKFELSQPMQWQLWFLCFLAWVYFVVNLTAAQTGEFMPDGVRIRHLLRYGRDLERVQLHLMLFQAVRSGLRPREWAVARMETLLIPFTEACKWDEAGIDPDKVHLLEGLSHTLAFYCAWDRGEYALATKLIGQCFNLPGTELPFEDARLRTEAAFCAAAFQADAANTTVVVRDLDTRAHNTDAPLRATRGDREPRTNAKLQL